MKWPTAPVRQQEFGLHDARELALHEHVRPETRRAHNRRSLTMTGRTTDRRTLFDCPACTEPIAADLVFDVKLTPIAESEGEPLPLLQASATAFLELAGVRVSHDCMPKATRGYAAGGDTRLPTGDAPIQA